MIFQRLIWSALVAALLVGTVQTGVQRWQVAPLILAAEALEEQKAAGPDADMMSTENAKVEPAVTATVITVHEHAHDPDHAGAPQWQPENGLERTGWTWVANVLHAFSMALLALVVMAYSLYRRGVAMASMRLGAMVAAAGWLSFHLWPSLGLPAEVPGMEAAPLQARQLWWLLAVVCAASACAICGFVKPAWRWLLAAALLSLPFLVGAPQLQGDALAGYNPQARPALAQLESQFIWATVWVSLTFWGSMALVAGLVFQRWVRPALVGFIQQTSAQGATKWETAR